MQRVAGIARSCRLRAQSSTSCGFRPGSRSRATRLPHHRSPRGRGSLGLGEDPFVEAAAVAVADDDEAVEEDGGEIVWEWFLAGTGVGGVFQHAFAGAVGGDLVDGDAVDRDVVCCIWRPGEAELEGSDE